ncbi:16S rRNA (guanine(966)-N(2))-methyltransferase [Caenispirillum salinarum AK4]|uniref:16S rRNA (Guanine(966)-N(2))-methyltransferase n=1 Tax=Caenispirillum salinarum AK4 TaxID=1238182 RepID=K9HV71_9PROT|nr:16S rRNA (guanine(966)-N(2))-methyltransferase RsmD [Caenispirillum salinarum]EKV32131.1 16S rRNA (guanine(966)-N(2))-methyltransferase [Caenispirillum salinarum AK4]
MRIVAGIHRGRRLSAPEGRDVRPTADRTREAVFSKLGHGWDPDDFQLQGARVLDAFAGTGALGLEALSRGAAHVTFLEQAPASLAVLKQNVETLKAGRDVTITRADATRPPAATAPCSLVLMDPPYDSGLETPALIALAQQGWIAPRAVCVVEVPSTRDPEPPEGFVPEDVRVYGKAKVAYLRYAP